MRFWDASAIVPLLVEQRHTKAVHSILAKDTLMMVWWATRIECASALARLARENSLHATRGMNAALDRLKQFAANWQEIEPSEEVREAAIRFLRVHSLRAGDALQLAAAFVTAHHQPTGLKLVTLDDRLAIAAQNEGFEVVEVTSAD
jgi:predicted nucleic acid-binding protein